MVCSKLILYIEDTPKTEYQLSSHIQIFNSSLPFVTTKAGQGGGPYQPLQLVEPLNHSDLTTLKQFQQTKQIRQLQQIMWFEHLM